VPPPEPEPAREQEAEPEPVARLPLNSAQPREWNIWDLERLAREAEGQDSTRDEELAFLLLELRQFANADGRLPVGFDPVVRESFGDLLYAAV
jgi:acyl-homoserine lactone acylase PvdQ